jgi:hypothetical protein
MSGEHTMDINRFVRAVRPMLAASLALPIAACMSSTPRWDAQFGDSVRLTLSQQIRDPEAGNNAKAPDGVDGRAATEALERYHKSFRDPQPQSSGLSTTVGVK